MSSSLARLGRTVPSRLTRYRKTTTRNVWRKWKTLGRQPGTQLCALRQSSSVATRMKQEAMAREQQEEDLEKVYERKTPLEHILLRPGMYVGPNERSPPHPHWVVANPPPPPAETSSGSSNNRLVSEQEAPPFALEKRECSIVPALVKIFDEILVNASDNRLRHPESCTRIDVDIDPGQANERAACIRILNDGQGIPVAVHPKEGTYIPELLFGHLLTGSNFDDQIKRVTGGRHGFGAKLTNIFSTSFALETVDTVRGLRYRQRWRDNMTVCEPPEITASNADERSYTCVTFVPDLIKLTGVESSMTSTTATGKLTMAPDDYAFMCRRVLDVAGCTAGSLQVTLNGQVVSYPDFRSYAALYRREESLPVVFEALNERWKVAVGLSAHGSLETVSFVNGMSTHRGGTHINGLIQQLVRPIQEKIAKINPHLKSVVTAALIRRHLFVACDALIENPTFDSQMKEYLTSSPQNFGSSFEFSKKFVTAVLQEAQDGGPGIVEYLVQVASSRQHDLMKEIVGKPSKRNFLAIPKLEDAHKAGTSASPQCTLILTEGDSAKALAVAGLEVVGRSTFGVFPLRGKFLNVRHATVEQMAKNAEVKALCAIIGLDFDKSYESLQERQSLRYGRVMLMTDQDADGSHIKGLVVNFFRFFWPGLLLPTTDTPVEDASEFSFLSFFVTPLLKATTKAKSKDNMSFYSIAEYANWRRSIDPESMKRYKVKYYKGLGTSTPAEAKDYFSAFDMHVRPFRWDSDADGEMLDMVFDKEQAAERRSWILREYDESSTLSVDHDRGNSVSYEDFVNNELVHFSHADNIRSIPNAIDGLKPSQRKVLYACFKRKLHSEVKVAQLTGYCAEQTAYHHGETSLHSTIIGMAQDFVGSNNINLLMPSGQFGTRLTGGKDAASPRYIFTYLSPVARFLFPEADDALLEYIEDDGQKIEPTFYCPVIPLLLVNGSEGIGTGWSTFIPPHDPFDVINYVRGGLDDNVVDLPVLAPSARSFKGDIERTPNGYASIGRASRCGKKSILIDELPLNVWTTEYKKRLLKMSSRGEIHSFVENHTTTDVSFDVKLKSVAQLERYVGKGLDKVFRLRKSLPTTNMNAFGADEKLHKFETATDIADAFFPVRMSMYERRKALLEAKLAYDAAIMKNKARFIEAVSTDELTIAGGGRSKADVVDDLHAGNFATSKDLAKILHKDSPDVSTGDEFNYLLNMPIVSLAFERIAELKADAEKREEDLQRMQATTPSDLWRTDLDRLEVAIHKQNKIMSNS